MDCYNHAGHAAIAQCNDCGKGLCGDCSEKFHPPICDACITVRNNYDKGQAANTIMLAVVAMVAGLVIGVVTEMDIGPVIVFGLWAACIPFGWKTLTKITPQMFVFLPLVGWLIYFGLKFALACVVGVVAMPIFVIKAISDLVTAKKFDDYINQ